MMPWCYRDIYEDVKTNDISVPSMSAPDVMDIYYYANKDSAFNDMIQMY